MGESGNGGSYVVEREVENIAALIDAAGGTAMVFGISSGAILALDAANRLPGITRLAVYEPPLVVEPTGNVLPEDFHDITLLGDTNCGRPLATGRWSSVTVPTLVVDGGKSPEWMHEGTRALAEVLGGAEHKTLDGQTHMVKPRVLGEALTAFFGSEAPALSGRAGAVEAATV